MTIATCKELCPPSFALERFCGGSGEFRNCYIHRFESFDQSGNFISNEQRILTTKHDGSHVQLLPTLYECIQCLLRFLIPTRIETTILMVVCGEAVSNYNNYNIIP